MKSSVTYLGYCIDSEGLHPKEDKLDAVQPLKRRKLKIGLANLIMVDFSLIYLVF